MEIKPPYRMKKLELERWLTDNYFDHYADEILKKDRYKKTYSKKALQQAVDEHIYHIVHHTNEFWEYIELGNNINYDHVTGGFYIEDDSLLWSKGKGFI